ncbi:MAG: 50S ribosomal protein L29 [Candidatus Peribacteria bacterium]|nr:MAG: 50S ribosomal protein L29 [Candidatus Peribacteria bacterium]
MAKKDFVKGLTDKSVAQLKELLEAYQKEYYALTVKNKLRSLTQTHLMKEKRRDIARIKTVLHAKQSS